MPDLRDLYQEVIVDHSKHPRNCCRLKEMNHTAEGFNPLCGDRLTVYLYVVKDVIQAISFEGTGCAISTASASLMTECLLNKTLKEAEQLFTYFHNMLTQESGTGIEAAKLGKLAVLSGVSEFPSRVKCATLAWHTVRAALHDQSETISTE